MPDPSLIAIPIYIVLMLAEAGSFRLWPSKDQHGYGAKDTAISIALGLGYSAITTVLAVATLAFNTWVYEHRFFDIGEQMGQLSGGALVLAWLALIVIDDFGFYWYHRVHHESRAFWAVHVVHHSSQRYNLSTAVRQPWVPFTGMLFYVPAFLVGFTPLQWSVVHGFNLIYQFWIHTERIGRMPRWFEFVFNTPSHHRVHHGANPEYLDRNYGGILILWDRMFGTFEDERARARYGLTKNIRLTWNMAYTVLHEFGSIGRDVRSARTPQEAWGYVFRRPGWRPDGSEPPRPIDGLGVPTARPERLSSPVAPGPATASEPRSP